MSAGLNLLSACGRRYDSAHNSSNVDATREGASALGVDAPTRPLRVAAAADLANAFGDIGREFERRTGTHVQFTFGSTGLLARQIEEGAPYDVFASASVAYVDNVIRSGACDGSSKRMVARGKLALYTKEAAQLPGSLAEVPSAARTTIAIANPEHAPYGLAAVQALDRSGLSRRTTIRMVFGDNVQHALMYATSGNADFAIVAVSLAQRAKGAFIPLSAALHDPIEQAMVVCFRHQRRPDHGSLSHDAHHSAGEHSGASRDASAETQAAGTAAPNSISAPRGMRDAAAFAEFVVSETGRATLKEHGFDPASD